MPKKHKVHPLKRWRLQHGMTQKELAAMLGIHYSNITYWETGSRPIPAMRAWKISNVTGLKAEVLRPDVFGGLYRA